jgi:hypothetical protein
MPWGSPCAGRFDPPFRQTKLTALLLFVIMLQRMLDTTPADLSDWAKMTATRSDR